MIKKNDIVKFFIGDEAIIGRVKYMAPGGFQKWKVFSNAYGYNRVYEIHQDNLKLLERNIINPFFLYRRFLLFLLLLPRSQLFQLPHKKGAFPLYLGISGKFQSFFQ